MSKVLLLRSENSKACTTCSLRNRSGEVTISVLFLAIQFITLADASWWLLGTDYNFGQMSDMAPQTSDQCLPFKSILNLTHQQVHICRRSPKIFNTIREGAKLGIQECQFQLQSHKWNCSTIPGTLNVFGKTLEKRTRERAYVYAISSAALAFQVTKSCAKGELEDCSCDENVRTKDTKGKWQWGGCSEDVRYGARLSKEFVDSSENPKYDGALMNLHNNEAGRRIMKKSTKKMCKCHGVSGACTMKVCWRVLRPFRKIGERIKEKFEGAFLVKAVPRKKRDKKVLRLRPKKKGMKRATRKDLVFLEDSPTYCDRNHTMHILGTSGRVCNRTSLGPEGCSVMCCGRGYQTMVREGEEKCNCRFVWCCNVECDSCPFKRDEHVCN